MATKKNDVDINELRKQLAGHSRVVVTDENGVEYGARYTRKLVKEMEAKGVTAESAGKMLDSGTLTGIEEFLEKFIFPAFKAEQPDLDFEVFLEVWGSLDSKEELIRTFMLLFSAPSMALVTNPTETRAKFRLV